MNGLITILLLLNEVTILTWFFDDAIKLVSTRCSNNYVAVAGLV
jgi:hypothetical protein